MCGNGGRSTGLAGFSRRPFSQIVDGGPGKAGLGGATSPHAIRVHFRPKTPHAPPQSSVLSRASRAVESRHPRLMAAPAVSAEADGVWKAGETDATGRNGARTLLERPRRLEHSRQNSRLASARKSRPTDLLNTPAASIRRPNAAQASKPPPRNVHFRLKCRGVAKKREFRAVGWANARERERAACGCLFAADWRRGSGPGRREHPGTCSSVYQLARTNHSVRTSYAHSRHSFACPVGPRTSECSTCAICRRRSSGLAAKNVVRLARLWRRRRG